MGTFIATGAAPRVLFPQGGEPTWSNPFKSICQTGLL